MCYKIQGISQLAVEITGSAEGLCFMELFNTKSYKKNNNSICNFA